MTKAELHIKGIKKVYIQFAFKVDFLLCLSSYVRSNYGKFVDSKSSRCKAKMPGVVGGWKKISNKDAGNDCIVDGLLAITKTMRIWFASSGGKFKFYFGHGDPDMQENSVDPENPEAVVNENLW